ncbi:hypothetical protein DESUT3_00750 [Desulfuromonas versatilis]|uniref:TonB C-terminal domain-containing protein n=1 Tax=Desulfuromonas versatilis TaxID=2802975 RepID=A0ABM8HQD7_9BACT|nr:energy transducer TonB [Desulfuromonas versatilis]BCR03006.1 hypothetical protein DESUT3_00750 [Desulfuromonas versatilis]
MVKKPLIAGLLVSLLLHLALFALPGKPTRLGPRPLRAVEVGLRSPAPAPPERPQQPATPPAASKPVAPPPALKPAPVPEKPEPAPATPKRQASFASKSKPTAATPLREEAAPKPDLPARDSHPTPPPEQHSAAPAPDPTPAPAPPAAVPDSAASAAPSPVSPGAAPPNATASPAPEVVSTPPAYLHTPRPTYPRQARLRRWEGEVLLKVRVGISGRVLEATLEHSSGYPVLDRSALEGVHAWRFRPATSNGTPVEEEVRVPVRFSLKDS